MAVALTEGLPEPRELVLKPRPGVSVLYVNGSVIVDVDYGLRASDLTSAVGRMVPADVYLSGATRRGARLVLTFVVDNDDSTRGEMAGD